MLLCSHPSSPISIMGTSVEPKFCSATTQLIIYRQWYLCYEKVWVYKIFYPFNNGQKKLVVQRQEESTHTITLSFSNGRFISLINVDQRKEI